MTDGVRRSVARALNVQEDHVLPKPDLGKYAFEIVHKEESMTNKDRPFVENGDAIPAAGTPEFVESEIDKSEPVPNTGKTESIIDPEKFGKGPLNPPKEMPLGEALKEMEKDKPSGKPETS